MSRPTPAERARSTVRLSPYLRVRMPGAAAEVDLHGTDPDGSVVLVVPEDSPVVAAVRRATADVPVLVDAADRDNAEALLDIGSGRTVLYVDVVEVHVTVAGADPDDVGAVEVVRQQDYARPGPTRWPAPRRRCWATSSPATRVSCAGWPSWSRPTCGPAPSRSPSTATAWCCAAGPRTSGSRSAPRCTARASCRPGCASC